MNTIDTAAKVVAKLTLHVFNVIAVVVAVDFGLRCCFFISCKFMLRLQTATISRHKWPSFGRTLAPIGEVIFVFTPYANHKYLQQLVLLRDKGGVTTTE